MNTCIQEFISGKRIAVVGASRTNDKYKFGNMAAEELKRRGYEISFVHPQAETINGEAAYPSLSSLTGKVDGVLVSLPASKSGQVLKEAAAAGLRNVWVQQGGESPELIQMGEQLKLNLVTGKCILMYAKPVRGYHTIHRFIARAIGQL
jgi:predicted CoA-binding protein